MSKEKEKKENKGIIQYFFGNVAENFGIKGFKSISKAVILNALIPGAGMISFKMYGRAIVNFVLVTLLFVMGYVNRADVNPLFTKQPETIYQNIKDTGFDIGIKVLKQSANYGNPLYCGILSAYKAKLGKNDPYLTDYRYRFFDIGTAYLVVSGLINILFMFHFSDIYIYKKKLAEVNNKNG